MKLINPNNEILKFIEKLVKESGWFKSFTKDKYNLNTNLNKKSLHETSIIEVIIECERKWNININDRDIWNIKTPLDMYLIISNKIKDENQSKQ